MILARLRGAAASSPLMLVGCGQSGPDPHVTVSARFITLERKSWHLAFHYLWKLFRLQSP